MSYKTYLLDTHVLYYLFIGSSKLPKNIKEDIIYCQNKYFVHVMSLIEFVQLQQIEKIRFEVSADEILAKLNDANITVFESDYTPIQNLSKLQVLVFDKKKHTDQFDRVIIADAIANKFTMVSHDTKFPKYCKYGLNLLEI